MFATAPTDHVFIPGWNSGTMSGSACSKAAEEEADSWIFVDAFLLIMSVYFVGGIVVKKQQGRAGPGDWLPNHQFWTELYGLVIDGIGLVARGGKPAGYAEISAAVDAMATETATGVEASRSDKKDAEDPVPNARQATRSNPTSLHSTATLGDVKKLKKLLTANNPSHIDAGDSRRYTAFHVACAAGHLDCKILFRESKPDVSIDPGLCVPNAGARLLRNAGCDTELTNDVGLTGW